MRNLALAIFTMASGTALTARASDEGINPRSLPLMQCIATHEETDLEFYGEGLKWVGSHMAIKACEEWAESEGKATDKCRIASCEPVFEY